MIIAAACIPQTPLLLPGITGGPVPDVEHLRTAVHQAIDALAALEPDEILIVGAAPATQIYPADAPAPTGQLAPAPDRRPLPHALPPALAVARAAVQARAAARTQPLIPQPLILQGVAAGTAPHDCRELGRRLAGRPGRSALLAAADGSARRGEKAPGHIDQRAIDLDADIGRALATADTAALLALDPTACRDLLIAGRAAWQVMAQACTGQRWTPGSLYQHDPFGVAYWVITWSPAAT